MEIYLACSFLHSHSISLKNTIKYWLTDKCVTTQCLFHNTTTYMSMYFIVLLLSVISNLVGNIRILKSRYIYHAMLFFLNWYL